MTTLAGWTATTTTISEWSRHLRLWCSAREFLSSTMEMNKALQEDLTQDAVSLCGMIWRQTLTSTTTSRPWWTLARSTRFGTHLMLNATWLITSSPSQEETSSLRQPTRTLDRSITKSLITHSQKEKRSAISSTPATVWLSRMELSTSSSTMERPRSTSHRTLSAWSKILNEVLNSESETFLGLIN